MYVFLENSKLSSKVTVPFCTPSSNMISFHSTALSALGVVHVLDFEHSKCGAVSNYCFNMLYMWTYVVEHLFICFFAIFMSSLVRCLLKSLAYFLIRLCLVGILSVCFWVWGCFWLHSFWNLSSLTRD